MKQDELKELKEAYIENTKKATVENGGMFSHIAIFGIKIDTNQSGTLYVPVDDEFVSSKKGKELFEKVVLPEIANRIKKDYIVSSAVWTSEAWLRTSNTEEFKSVRENWQELPIKMETLIMSFRESDDNADIILYEINRTGKKVTDDGKMIDTIELELISNFTRTDGMVPGGRLFDMLSLFF